MPILGHNEGENFGGRRGKKERRERERRENEMNEYLAETRNKSRDKKEGGDQTAIQQ